MFAYTTVVHTTLSYFYYYNTNLLSNQRGMGGGGGVQENKNYVNTHTQILTNVFKFSFFYVL